MRDGSWVMIGGLGESWDRGGGSEERTAKVGTLALRW